MHCFTFSGVYRTFVSVSVAVVVVTGAAARCCGRMK